MTRLDWRASASVLAIALSTSAEPAAAQNRAELDALRAQVEALAAQNEALMQRLEAIEAEQVEIAERTAPETVVNSGNSRTRLEVYGQVNRGILAADNGDVSEVFFVDGGTSSTRFGLRGEGDVGETTTVGGNIEVELLSNSSSRAPSDRDRFGPSGGDFEFRRRLLEVYARDANYGSVWLGHGSTASDGTTEVSFAGTSVAGGSSGIADLGGALRFAGSNTRVRNAFDNFDGNGRQDRIRYDTPSFSGFSAGVSVADKGDFDIAARWAGDFGSGVRAGVAGHVLLPGEDGGSKPFDTQFGGSGSLSFGGGFSATVAAAARDGVNGRDPYYVYGLLGYQTSDLTDLGRTSFGVDVYFGEDIQRAEDQSTTVGLFAVQQIQRAGAELYAGYRWYDLDREGESLDSINALLTGARLRF